MKNLMMKAISTGSGVCVERVCEKGRKREKEKGKQAQLPVAQDDPGGDNGLTSEESEI